MMESYNYEVCKHCGSSAFSYQGKPGDIYCYRCYKCDYPDVISGFKKKVYKSLEVVKCRKCYDKKCECIGRNKFSLKMFEEEKAILRCECCKFNSIWFWPFRVEMVGVNDNDLDESFWKIYRCTSCLGRTLHYWRESHPTRKYPDNAYWICEECGRKG